ncbi:PhzF family phenazine biosynthesis protein [Aureisphaera galaxeae]|uniref:PhzF family phenazine biosynthesis protein n=1 Tax=Aureisphaera galaxeae TaxID=1538023 RepID=UPI002350737C|nr:PhzF family phenazine biosynthesis protein [Aureisphaera galaxeae]MDC8004826.1 PhzF family phenazine biosynthesis protein [Aureisphaera galaxeae]
MKKIDYYILDVFAKNKYGGNQLAVNLDLEDALNEDEMLSIAKEINFAESTFIKQKLGENKYAVRIFTTESEIPFAGHPTIGTSYVIANYLMRTPSNTIILDLMNGEIEVVLSDVNQIESCLYTMTQSQPAFLKEFEVDEVATGLGIAPSILSDTLPIQEISTGLPFIIIPIQNLEGMNQIKLNAPQFKDFLLKHQLYKSNSPSGISTSLLFFTDETFENGNDYNVRMFCIEDEILKEDSATGSANGCFLAYLLRNKSDVISAKIEQGFQMNRKSYLYLEGKRSGNMYDIKVGGYSITMSKGTWIL